MPFWDTKTGKVTETRELLATNGAGKKERLTTNAIRLSPDGKYLATMGPTGIGALDPRNWNRFFQKIRIIDVATWTDDFAWDAPERAIHNPEFSPDGKLLALAEENGTTTIWDWKERKKTRDLERVEVEEASLLGGIVPQPAWSPDGKSPRAGKPYCCRGSRTSPCS